MRRRSAPAVSRRGFIEGAAATLVAFSLRPALADVPGDLAKTPLLDAWIRIQPGGGVVVNTGKVELGQGVLTALAQIAAEELDVDPRRVLMISGDTALTPDEGMTAGSQSIEQGGAALRQAAAEARALLLVAASRQLGVKPAALKTENGAVIAPDGSRIPYEQIPTGMLHRSAAGFAAAKQVLTYRVVGASLPRLDLPAKVTGQPIYVQDLRLPGMVFGRVVRAARPGAVLVEADLDAARALPRVLSVVRDGSFLGVVAEHEEQAIAARDCLAQTARWEGGRAVPDDLPAFLETERSDDQIVGSRDVPAAAVARRFGARYTRQPLAHASIGPSCAVALWSEGEVRVWSHTQGVYPLRQDLAKALRLDPANVRVSHVQGSGCYGHNGADDAALDAALLARTVPGHPVKLQWMRDDEFRHEPYGSAMTVRLSAGLDVDGSIAEWSHDAWSNGHNNRPGQADGVNLLAAAEIAARLPRAKPKPIPQPAGGADRNAIPLYDFPKQRIVNHHIVEMPLRTSALRTLGACMNVFAIESFMDELASEAQADPVAFRLAHLSDARGRMTIERAAAAAGWNPAQRSAGFGFARYKNHAAYVAAVAEVVLDRDSGRVRATRLTLAVDAGLIVNPDGLTNQIEGGAIQAASWVQLEAVVLTDGVAAGDFGAYPILAFPDVPEVAVHLISRPDEPSLGAGEAAAGPVAAAIGNAVARLAGVRVRDLPLTPGRIKAALESSRS